MHNRMDIATTLARAAHPVHGIVSAVDPINHAVKVKVQPEDVETGWLADAGGTAVGDLRIARPTAIGTHVLLAPTEGDAEHLTIIGHVYDTVMTPPVSPATGQPAQPGEMLIMTGRGAPPVDAASNSVGAATTNAPWWHITPDGMFCGAGVVSAQMTSAGFVWKVGDVTMTLDAGGLSITGGTIVSDTDVLASAISLKAHVHSGVQSGPSETGEPVA